MPILQALVEVDTATIRCSITSLDPKHSRILPCVYKTLVRLGHREGTTHVITDESIKDALVFLLRFKATCKDYGADPENVRVVVCCFTQSIANFAAFERAIRRETNWAVELLTKEEELSFDLHGVAANTHRAQGLFFKLSASYILVNWVSCARTLESGTKPVAVPLGYMSVMQRMEKDPSFKVEEEIEGAVRNAVSRLSLPEHLKEQFSLEKRTRLYVVGSIYKILALYVPGAHPIPILNGYTNTPEAHLRITQSELDEFADTRLHRKDQVDIFKCVSRIHRAVLKALPQVRKLFFIDAKLREGALYRSLPPEIKMQDPVIVATRPFAFTGTAKLTEILRGALPAKTPEIILRILPAVANAAYLHASYPDSVQSTMALLVATTGILGGTDGLSFEVRSLLGLALCNRWGCKLDSTYMSYRLELMEIPTKKLHVWYALYLGSVLRILGSVYPSNTPRKDSMHISTLGDANDFTLTISLNQNSVFSNNLLVKRRVKNLPRLLDSLSSELDTVPACRIETKWYNGVVETD